MADPPTIGYGGGSIRSQSPNNHTPKPKWSTLFASIIISLPKYFFILYIFNISPYDLLYCRVFWFIVIFSILFILSGDYGAFSSSHQNQHPTQEYARYSYSRTRNPPSSYVTMYEEVAIENCLINYPKQEQGANKLLKENKDAIEVDERVTETVAQNDDPKKPRGKYSNNEREPLLSLEIDRKACEEKHVPTKIYGQSKSCVGDQVERLVIDDGTKKMKMSRTTKVEAKVEEENEIDAVTSEELNRRVEEFIQKFKTQIRLQAVRNLH